MRFEEILEIVRKEDAEFPAGELAVMLNGYMHDICNEVEGHISEIEVPVKTDSNYYNYDDLGDAFLQSFMKAKSVNLKDKVIVPLGNSVDGDYVVEYDHDGFLLGKRNYVEISPLMDTDKITLEYYSYPSPITVNTGILPIPQASSMYLWRIKADLYAEKRHWDRAGYYNRRYERALINYRRMVQSSGPTKIIHPNTRI